MGSRFARNRRELRMEAYKQEFIKFMVESDVLKFGEMCIRDSA